MKKVVSLIAVGFWLSGCATITQKHQFIASGQTGCAPETIVVENEKEIIRFCEGEYESWTAKCAGKTYRCSGSYRSASGTCKEAQ